MGKSGKRYRTAVEAMDPSVQYSLAEAVALIKGADATKFDESVDLAINLGVDPGTQTRWCAERSFCRTA